MCNSEIEKLRPYVTTEIIGYVPDSVCSKIIIKKITGSVRAMSFDTNTGLSETTSPFDTFAQMIEGTAEFVIDKNPVILETGQSLIIPAHSTNHVKAKDRCKMIMTVIKSGYE